MNQKTSIFHYSKYYGSVTGVTRLKVALNMADSKCHLETARILNRLCCFYSENLLDQHLNASVPTTEISK